MTQVDLQALNNYLASRSYLDGYVASQADNKVLDALSGKAPEASLFHALRWFNHLRSFNDQERKAFGQSSKGGEFLAGGAAAPAAKKADDDDIDLFGDDDDEDDEAKAKLHAERVAMYAAKKEKKPALVAKSCVKLDIKPWDDETNLDDMEAKVKGIQMDGLVWGNFQRVPVAYGVKKLVANCVIEDDKVSTIDLEEQIQAFEDVVQSVDIVSFNKL